MTEAELETEAWRPSYVKSREPSVENDFTWDNGMTSFDTEWGVDADPAFGLASLNQNASIDDLPRGQPQPHPEARVSFGHSLGRVMAVLVVLGMHQWAQSIYCKK